VSNDSPDAPASPGRAERVDKAEGAGDADITRIRDAWGAILERLASSSRVAWTAFHAATPVSCAGGALAVAVAEPGNARAIAARGHDERLRQAIIDVLALDLTIDVLHDPEPAAPGPGRGGDQSGASGQGRPSPAATQLPAGPAPGGSATKPSVSPDSSRSGRPADVVRAAGSASPQDEGTDEPSPDDPDVESEGANGLALITRELGARPIGEIDHS